uniref:EF-hand domain-containing protein n=1 Tax=Arion vulgaris TaxID=1028688 RepID=A0A0B7ACZ5_9EUPU
MFLYAILFALSTLIMSAESDYDYGDYETGLFESDSDKAFAHRLFKAGFKNAFKEMDKNNDGVIDQTESKVLFKKGFDLNKDGKIPSAEFEEKFFDWTWLSDRTK